MRRDNWIGRVGILCFVLVFVVGISEQRSTAKEFTPEIGQEGKDVIWVPTELTLVNTMLDMARVTPQDYVIDLGSGDGRIVIAAAKRGARALGIEYNPDMVELSKNYAKREGVADRVQFIRGDIFETDFSQATVITMFLLPELNLKLRPQILNLKPGTRVVSNSFDMGDWKADEIITLDPTSCSSYCTAYLWIVPAKIGGEWKLPQGELIINQHFQKFTGKLQKGKKWWEIKDGSIVGTKVSFSAGKDTYAGEVRGETMEISIIKDGKRVSTWMAQLIKR